MYYLAEIECKTRNAFLLLIHKLMSPEEKNSLLVFDANLMEKMAEQLDNSKLRTVYQIGHHTEYKRMNIDSDMVIEYRVNDPISKKFKQEAYLFEIKVGGKCIYQAPQLDKVEKIYICTKS